MWGVGTAIGELPPYFMARTARLSGEELDDEEEDSKWKQTIENLIEKFGFIAILLLASVRKNISEFRKIFNQNFN